MLPSPRLPALCSCFAQATHDAEWYLLTVTAFLNRRRAMACTCSDSLICVEREEEVDEEVDSEEEEEEEE